MYCVSDEYQLPNLSSLAIDSGHRPYCEMNTRCYSDYVQCIDLYAIRLIVLTGAVVTQESRVGWCNNDLIDFC
jgi:hypothetical protein